MGARLVLLAFILVDALVGIAMSPAHGWIAPLDEWIWDGLTLGTFAVLLGLEYPAQLLADRLGIQGQTVVVALLGVICLLIAAFAIVRLVREARKARDVPAHARRGRAGRCHLDLVRGHAVRPLSTGIPR